MTTQQTCPECGATVKTYHNIHELGNGRTRTDGWGAECRNVMRCKIARGGIVGYGPKRPDAIADFIEKAKAWIPNHTHTP